jgi:NitT/TauT family transport system permease protein
MTIIEKAAPMIVDDEVVPSTPWYSTSLGRGVLAAAVFVAVLVLWTAYVRIAKLSPLVLPTPYAVWQSLIENTVNGQLPEHAVTTLIEIILGFLLGSVVGIVLGVVTAQSELMREMLSPYILASQAMPKLALAPIMVVWMGFGIAPKVVITALICFFPLLENTIIGLTSTNPHQLELFRALSATNWQTFIRLRVPSALPVIFTGLRVAVTLAVVGAVVGEYVGANKGLGALVIVTQGSFDTPLMFAIFVYLTVIGIVLYKLMQMLETTFFSWRTIKRGD